jgi:SsrA-binding protein
MIDAAKINVQNKRAGHEFEIIERFEAGIMLKGSEIKSVRNGGGSITEAFCLIRDGEVFVKNMNIPEYSHGSYANHEVLRMRKLLLNKRELNKIDTKIRERGFSVIPIRLFINDRGFAKLEIGLGRGKKKFDKRESLKQKDSKREMDRVMKKYR